VTNNQQPGPTGDPTPGVPDPVQQPYPPQQNPPQQNPPQLYPPQQYPAAYPGQPYPGQQPYAGQQPIPGQPYPGQQPVPGQPYGGQPYTGQQPMPGQPYATQPYPGQPYAAQQPYPGQQPYGPQGPVPPYGAAGQPPGKPKGKGALILGITGGVVVLAVIASFLVPRNPVLPVTPQLPATTATVPSAPASVPASVPGATVTPVTQSDTAQAAVQGYLQAVSSGDSASAIAYAANPPMEQSLLTDELLAANQAVAPITDIAVTEGTGSDHQTVQAAYNLGGTPVSTTFEVTRVNGVWLLDAVAAPLPLDLSTIVGVDLTINGVQLLNINPTVFPGRYTVATSSGWYKLSGGTVQVENATPSGGAPAATLALASSGVSAIRKAAQAKLNSCLKKNSLAPAGCGFGTYLPGNNKVRSSSINWRVVNGGTAMRKLTPSLDAPDSAIAKVSVKTRVDCSSTNGRRWRGFSTVHYVYATLRDGKVQVTLGA